MEEKNIKEENKTIMDNLLEEIDELLLKYKQYPTDKDIEKIINNRVKNIKEQILTKKSITDKFKENVEEEKQLKKIKGENYYSTSWVEALTIMYMFANRSDESERQFLRANYNLQSNNEIFRILDIIYNNNLDNSDIVDYNNYILKINISFFLVEYIFELIKKEIEDIIESEDNYEYQINDLISKYKCDIQSIGEVMMISKPRDAHLRPRYNEMKEYIRSRGYDNSVNSKFKIIRNAASHGEYYPDFDNESNIKIIVDGNGVERETINYLDLIGYVESRLNIISDKEEINIFLKLFRSNNITNTIINLKENEQAKKKLISNLCLLSLFNIIQYNNENHFRVDKTDNAKESYIDNLDLKHFFTTSYDIESKNNFEIMQTIKNAIGHMNVTFENDRFTFDNKMVNEQCSCSLKSLLLFIMEDEVYNITMATSYYEKYSKISKRIKDNLMLNKTFNSKDWMSEEIKQEWNKNQFENKIDLSKYNFYDFNNINKHK